MMPGFFAGGAMGSIPLPPATPSAFFASDPMLSTAWGQVTYPASIYVSGIDTTIVCWQFVGLAGYKGVHVAGYNHTTGQWGERYTVGNFLLADDDHGDAVLLRDADGYIHCWYGSHSNGQKYSVTNAPDDISTWTQRQDIGTTLTYPKPCLVGSTIYLFARERADSNNQKLTLTTMTPSSGAGTWSGFQNIVDFGADSRVYTAEAHVVGTQIHFVCTRANASDTVRKGVYYFIYETSDGSVKNFDSSTSVASGSLPVGLTLANSDFRVFDHGSNDGDLGSFQFDTTGNAHIIFADGTTPTYDLKHIMLSGGSWSSPATVDSIPDFYGSSGFVANYTLVQAASGAMEAWYNDSSGDKKRRIRASGGTWGSVETILTAGSLNLLQSNAVKDAAASLRTIFAENSGTTLDSGAVPLSLYAYGDSGPVNAAIDMSAVDPAGWSNVVMLLGARHRNAATSIIDESKSSMRFSLFGNAQIDTSQTPFAGGASLKLDGTGDYATAINNSAYSVAGTDDFCMDQWLRRNDTGRFQCVCTKRASSGDAHEYGVFISATNQLQIIMWNAGTVVLNITGTTAMTTGVWYFWEISRISGTTYLLYGPAGGTVALEASGTQSAAPTTNSTAFHIGRDTGFTTRDFNGWMADMRFTRAGRHTTSFAAPTTWAPRR